MPKTKKPALPTPRLVLVEWWDAYTNDSGWKSGKSLRKQVPVLVRSVGYVARDEPAGADGKPPFITIGGSWVEHDDHFDGDTTIPYGMIQGSVVELAPKQQKAPD